MLDLLSRVRGSCAVHYKGQDFWFNDVAAFEIDLKPFDVTSDDQGQIDSRAGGRMITLTGTPVGAWTVAQLAVQYPWLNARIGDFNTPVRTITAVATDTGALTSVGHGQLTGTGVRFGTVAGATLPTGIAANTTYYMAATDKDTITLYDTEAHAIANDGATGVIIPSAVGAGSIRFIVNSPLTITTQDGFQLVIWNAAIVTQPSNALGSVKTPFKQIKFEGYTLHGLGWKDANSLYTPTVGVVGAVPPQQTQIPTVPYTIDWGTRLPVTAVATGAGTSILTIANHGLSTAQAVTLDDLVDGDNIPGGLALGVTYYVIVASANGIKLATSAMNAGSGTSITFTSAGAGTIDVVTKINALGLKPDAEITIDHEVTWADVPDDENGIACRSIKKAMTKVSFKPTNLDLNTVLNAISVQGGTAARGQSLPQANLDIYGPAEDPFFRVYGATLQNAPARFGSDADRVDKLNFVSVRTFRGNVANPVAFIGIAAPTN
jgi:hypothetical protein